MTALESVLKENKVDEWKAYMRWSLLNRASSCQQLLKRRTLIFTVKPGAVKLRPSDEEPCK
jgi:endothelin-converting enzyme/putative endopeptidase